jgi:hypothetical protein
MLEEEMYWKTISNDACAFNNNIYFRRKNLHSRNAQGEEAIEQHVHASGSEIS